MRSSWIHIVAASTVLTAAVASERSLADEPKVARAAAGHEGFDPSVKPGDDFFRHVNGGWISRTEIPPDRESQ